jgi:hypothetical protein
VCTSCMHSSVHLDESVAEVTGILAGGDDTGW